jgi:protein-tyrosine phosphatase
MILPSQVVRTGQRPASTAIISSGGGAGEGVGVGSGAPVIDLHCHVLPGIDDGPTTIEGSLALARAAVAAGTRTLVATPHVSWRYANDSAVIAGAATELRERLDAEGIELELLTGAEIAMTRVGELDDGELTALRLAGGAWLLIEPPFTPVAAGLRETVLGLQNRGHRVLLAHPERCPAIHRDITLLEGLVAEGVLSSVTAGSLAGHFGEQVRRFALRLFERGLVHNVASDAHDHAKRAPGMTQEIARAGLGGLSGWLTTDVPQAILEGAAEVPERPESGASSAPSPRRWRAGRRRR